MRAMRAMRAMLLLTAAAAAAAAPCANTDRWATGFAADTQGYGCSQYNVETNYTCGGYDDNDFSSGTMCCICGGGNRSATPSEVASYFNDTAKSSNDTASSEGASSEGASSEGASSSYEGASGEEASSSYEGASGEEASAADVPKMTAAAAIGAFLFLGTIALLFLGRKVRKRKVKALAAAAAEIEDGEDGGVAKDGTSGGGAAISAAASPLAGTHTTAAVMPTEMSSKPGKWFAGRSILWYHIMPGFLGVAPLTQHPQHSSATASTA
eukprot:scaffold22957_cov58-Phaeocystis_antarctica.AAC.3